MEREGPDISGSLPDFERKSRAAATLAFRDFNRRRICLVDAHFSGIDWGNAGMFLTRLTLRHLISVSRLPVGFAQVRELAYELWQMAEGATIADHQTGSVAYRPIKNPGCFHPGSWSNNGARFRQPELRQPACPSDPARRQTSRAGLPAGT